PAVDQIECHPQFQQVDTRPILAEKDIRIEAWGPLGQGNVDYAGSVIADIAAAHEKSWAQTIIRWHLQKGPILSPKSNSRDRIEPIDALEYGGRVSGDPAEVNCRPASSSAEHPDRLPLRPGGDVLDRLGEEDPVGVLRDIAQVRGEHGARGRAQPVVDRQGLEV